MKNYNRHMQRLICDIDNINNEISKKLSANLFTEISNLLQLRFELIKRLTAEIDLRQNEELQDYFLALRMIDERFVEVLTKQRQKLQKTMANFDTLKNYIEI